MGRILNFVVVIFWCCLLTNRETDAKLRLPVNIEDFESSFAKHPASYDVKVGETTISCPTIEMWIAIEVRQKLLEKAGDVAAGKVVAKALNALKLPGGKLACAMGLVMTYGLDTGIINEIAKATDELSLPSDSLKVDKEKRVLPQVVVISIAVARIAAIAKRIYVVARSLIKRLGRTVAKKEAKRYIDDFCDAEDLRTMNPEYIKSTLSDIKTLNDLNVYKVTREYYAARCSSGDIFGDNYCKDPEACMYSRFCFNEPSHICIDGPIRYEPGICVELAKGKNPSFFQLADDSSSVCAGSESARERFLKECKTSADILKKELKDQIGKGILDEKACEREIVAEIDTVCKCSRKKSTPTPDPDTPIADPVSPPMDDDPVTVPAPEGFPEEDEPVAVAEPGSAPVDEEPALLPAEAPKRCELTDEDSASLAWFNIGNCVAASASIASSAISAGVPIDIPNDVAGRCAKSQFAACIKKLPGQQCLYELCFYYNKEANGLPEGCLECLQEAGGVSVARIDASALGSRAENDIDAKLLPVEPGRLEVERVCFKEDCKNGRCETERCTCVRLLDALRLSWRKKTWLINTWPSFGTVYPVKHGNEYVGITEGHILSTSGKWTVVKRKPLGGEVALVVGIRETTTGIHTIHDMSEAL